MLADRVYDAFEGRNGVMDIDLSTSSTHDLRHPGIRANHRNGGEMCAAKWKHMLFVPEQNASLCRCLPNQSEEHVLPLRRAHLTSIAVIGPNARVAQIMGGGSAQVNVHYAISPFEGIVNTVGGQISVRYEQGCTNHKYQPLLDMSLLLAGKQGSEHGLAIEYFNTSQLSGPSVLKETKTTSEFMWFGEMPKGVEPQQF